MALAHQLGVELEEESQQQETDVHTVHIGISRNHHVIVAEIVDVFIYVEGCLQQRELFVLVDILLGSLEAVQRLTLEAEDRLVDCVADLLD